MPPSIIIHSLIRSRRRTLALEIDRNGHLLVRAPLRAPLSWIQQVVKKKESWILKKQEAAELKILRCKPRKYLEGEDFLFLGTAYPLALENHQPLPLHFDGTRFILRRNDHQNAAYHFETWYRERALKTIEERSAFFAGILGRFPASVRLSRAVKRWGSCIGKGRLYFNWKLILAPPEILDYVVVHELCHLIERNHSPGFWKLVGTVLPLYRAHRDWLRKNGDQLDPGVLIL